MIGALFASALVVNHQSCHRSRSDADGEVAWIGIKVLTEQLNAIHVQKLRVALNGDNSARLGSEGG